MEKKTIKITNKKTGHAFVLSTEEAGDFFYTKNTKGKFINSSKDYIIQAQAPKSCDLTFILVCLALMFFVVSCVLVYVYQK